MLDTCLDLRVGELSALKFSDFEERSGYVHIQRMEVENTYKDESGKIRRDGYVVVPHVKSKKSNRYLLVSPAAKRILKLILDTQAEWGVTSEYLFVDKKGNRLHSSAFHNVMRRVLNPSIGTSQKSIHAVRRTGLSILRDELGGKESAQHGEHDEKVNKDHYYYRVDTSEDNVKNQTFFNALDKKMPDFLK